MREMLNDDEEKFSDDEAERMITFFSYHMNEDADILPDQLFPPGSEKIVEKKVVEKTELSPVPETQSQSVKNVTKTQPASPLKMEQTFNRKLTGFAKQCGYAAIILLLILLLSGAFRKQLGRQFTIIHRISAMLLLLCLAPHTAIYIMKYGNPPVLWYGLGIVGITTAILTQLTTVFRARIGRSFVKIHATIGVITLLIGLAHWIIAYL